MAKHWPGKRCRNCFRFRLNTNAEELVMYRKVCGYGSCGLHGNTVQDPDQPTDCPDWWSPLKPEVQAG